MNSFDGSAVELKADPGFPFFWASYKDHETPNEALLRMFKENLAYCEGDFLGTVLDG